MTVTCPIQQHKNGYRNDIYDGLQSAYANDALVASSNCKRDGRYGTIAKCKDISTHRKKFEGGMRQVQQGRQVRDRRQVLRKEVDSRERRQRGQRRPAQSVGAHHTHDVCVACRHGCHAHALAGRWRMCDRWEIAITD